MIILVIVLLFVIFYQIYYNYYSEKVIDFMLNVRCYKRIYYEVNKQLKELEEDEVIEINSRYYKYTVDKRKLEKYYTYLIEKFEELKNKYNNIIMNSNKIFFYIDEELEDMINDEYKTVEKLISKIKVKKWKNE